MQLVQSTLAKHKNHNRKSATTQIGKIYKNESDMTMIWNCMSHLYLIVMVQLAIVLTDDRFIRTLFSIRGTSPAMRAQHA